MKRERWLATPGAAVESYRPQFSTNPGPSGPAGIEKLTQILRAGRILPALRDNPRNGVRGKATMSTKCSSGAVPGGVLVPTMSTKCSSGAVPGGVLVPLPPWAKELAARRRRNSPAKRAIQRPDEGIGPYKKALYYRPLIRLACARHLPPQGEGLYEGIMKKVQWY